jgi:DNA-binding GntR family transcriptional regulator
MTIMALPKLEPSMRVGDQAYEAIHEAIMSGAFPAGRRLQIRQLAAELGISVMPVREAIKRLEEVGLVEAIPYRGAVVKQFTPQELLNLYAVRRLLEVEATVLGASGVSEKDVTRLRALWQVMAQSLSDGRIVDYLDQDEELLSIVYEASGNPVLLETIDTLWRRCRSYKIVGATRELELGNTTALLTFQEGIINAISAGDARLAGRITAQSLDAAIARIQYALTDSAEAEAAAEEPAAAE